MGNKALYWIPRILGIIAILFMMMFSLDCLGEGESFKTIMTCFFMHNIPALICIAVMILAWKRELPGGVLFILVFIAAGIFFGSFTGNWGSLIIITPFLVIGILFILHYFRIKQEATA